MSKVKEYYSAMDDYYDGDLYEYQALQYQEELESQGIHVMTEEEQIAYNQFMEGKLCIDQANTVHISSDTNLKDGRSSTGENATLKYRKRKSIE